MHQSLSPLLFPEYRRRVLALLLLRPEEALHGREVARRIGLPAGTHHQGADAPGRGRLAQAREARQPVIDGDVIPARPIDRIAGGAGADIDLMVGATSDEWRFFLVPSGAIQHISVETLAGVVAAYGLPVDRALEAYRAADPAAGAGDLLAELQGDWYVRIPVMRLADAHAKGAAATFMYKFAWPSRQFNGLLGACHGLEIGCTTPSGICSMWRARAREIDCLCLASCRCRSA